MIRASHWFEHPGSHLSEGTFTRYMGFASQLPSPADFYRRLAFALESRVIPVRLSNLTESLPRNG